jgi:hypothetical protein
MPTGTSAVQSQNIPDQPFVVSPDEFFAMTSRQEAPFETVAAGSSVIQGMTWSKQLPQTGIISRVKMIFEGTLVVTGAGVTTSARWIHGLLDYLALSVNGQNNLISLDGPDLQAQRFVRNPAYEDAVDVFPGSVGGGNVIAAGTYPIYVTWDLPIAMDDTSLVGALYAQSGSTTITLDRRLATNAQLFSANPANATLSGTFKSSVTRFSVPRSAQEGGPLVIPDLSRLHSINAIELPITATGDVRLPMIRSAGSLARLFFSGLSAPNTRLSAQPSAAAANKINAIRLEYGAAQVPYNYDPAAMLLAQNNNNYGAPAPYGRLVMDFVRENAPRDMVILQGVTELALVPTINSAVVLAGATGRLVQETLF